MSILRDSKKRKQVIAKVGTTLGTAIIAVNSVAVTALADDTQVQTNALDELNGSSNVVLVEGGIEEVARLEEEYLKAQQEAEEEAKAKAEAEAKAKEEAEKKKLQEQKEAEEKDKNIFEKVIDVIFPEEEDDIITENKEGEKVSDNQESKNDKVEENNSSQKNENSSKGEDKTTQNVTKEEFDKAVSGGDVTNDESDKKDDDVVTEEEFDQAVSGGDVTNDESDKKDDDVVTEEEFDQAVSGGNVANDESDKKDDNVVTEEEFDQAVSGGNVANNESDKKDDDVVTEEEFDKAVNASKNDSNATVTDDINNTVDSKENTNSGQSSVDEDSSSKKEEEAYEDGFWDMLFESLMPAKRKEHISIITSKPEVIQTVDAASNGSDASATREVSSNKDNGEKVSSVNEDSEGGSTESSTKEESKPSSSDTKEEAKTEESKSVSKHGYSVMSKDEMLKTIDKACEKYGIDPVLAKAQAMQESKFDQDALSYAGAAGVMQLMPKTAISLGLKVTDKVDERYDPEKNIYAGVKYIDECKRLSKHYFNKVTNELVLSIYNAGIGTVLKHNGVPDIAETKDYIKKVNNYMKDFK